MASDKCWDKRTEARLRAVYLQFQLDEENPLSTKGRYATVVTDEASNCVE